uniref:Uncharacterized protein n=1 Tax=Denticeps clupeoides TaxID=299321 RepID=A0AAY4A0G8_9TELE
DKTKGKTFYFARDENCFPCFFDSTDRVCYYPVSYVVGSQAAFLVNKDNFEILEWKTNEYSKIPSLSVETCNGIFIIRNENGIGYLSTGKGGVGQALVLPEGDTLNYQFLIVNHDIENQFISSIDYDLSQGAIDISQSPQILRHYAAVNNDCRPIKQQANLEKSVEKVTTFQVGGSLTVGIKTEIIAKVPFLAESKLELSGEVSLSLSYSSSTSDKSVHSVSMTVDVPPNHMCNMKITGNSIVTNVPFTGVITRTFKNKEVRTTSVSGTFNAQEVGEIRAIVDRYLKSPNCSSRVTVKSRGHISLCHRVLCCSFSL